MIILIGKSGSGKDTVASILCKKYGYNKIITHTTRPKRDTDDKDTYYFDSYGEYIKQRFNNNTMCVKVFTVSNGNKYIYWIDKNDFNLANKKSIIITDPDSARTIMNNNIDTFIYYIDIPDNIRRERLIKRGDNLEEIERRIKADNKDFENVRYSFNTNAIDIESSNKIASFINRNYSFINNYKDCDGR